jgi:hypothetical protein
MCPEDTNTSSKKANTIRIPLAQGSLQKQEEMLTAQRYFHYTNGTLTRPRADHDHPHAMKNK